MSKLAILGGTPVVQMPLPPYPSIGQAEIDAVVEVMKSGCLSGFYGSWGEEFLGGPQVRQFEQNWCDRFQVNHAVSVNSACSGLFAAMGAVGVGPGDEVIVPPYTMSATVMAPLIYGGIPIFVDIEPDTFCLDPALVRQAITPRTKAILAVNLFGHPAALHELRAIADQHHLYLIEDNAQGPLATEAGQYAGTVGHIGVFSLNYHKHIHTGEGGICTTNDAELAQRLQLIRNHGENVVEPLHLTDLTNLVGFNYRMTELSAAVGIAQLQRAEQHVGRREAIAQKLSAGIADLPGFTPPIVRPDCRHVYYVWAARFNAEEVGISRERFSQALTAEGVPHFLGYVRPLYLLPTFQQRIAIGSQGYPFNLGQPDYREGLCPVAERMWREELFCFETCAFDLTDHHLDLFIEAFYKVYTHRHELAQSTSLLNV